MTDIRFIVANELEIPSGCQIHIDERVLLVGNSSLVEFSVESHKDATVQTLWKSGRGESNIVRPLTFRAREWVRQWLKCNQRLNAPATNNRSSSGGGVISGKPEVRYRPVPNLCRRNPVKFIRA